MVTVSEVNLSPGHGQQVNPLFRGSIREEQMRALQRRGLECPEMEPGVSLINRRARRTDG